MNKISQAGIKLTHKKPVTWIVVADGSKARVYARQALRSMIPVKGKKYKEKNEKKLLPVQGMTWKAESPRNYDVNNDLVGGTFRNITPMHSNGSTERLPLREDLKRRFMKTVAGHLEEARKERLFDRLVLIAPPKLLKELKNQLCHHTLATIIAEMPKEMTNRNDQALKSYLEEIM